MFSNKIILEDDFHFEAGGTLAGLQVVFHTSMREYDGKNKVVWICHALTADSDVPGWWPQLVGPGKLIDTDRFL